jgi:hypothetical protein
LAAAAEGVVEDTVILGTAQKALGIVVGRIRHGVDVAEITGAGGKGILDLHQLSAYDLTVFHYVLRSHITK